MTVKKDNDLLKSLEDRVIAGETGSEDDAKIYHKHEGQTPDPRMVDERKKEGYEVVHENGSRYTGKKVVSDAETQILADNSIANLRKESPGRRQKIYAELERQDREMQKKADNYVAREDQAVDIEGSEKNEPDSATKTLINLRAADEGYNPGKTLKKAHSAYTKAQAKAEGVHTPNWKEAIRNTLSKGVYSAANVFDFSKAKESRDSASTYNTLGEGDRVVLYFGEKGHDQRRKAVSDSGMKYISVFNDGISGQGPGYSPKLTREERAKAVYEWARKIYEKTGKMPVVAGHGEDGKAVEGSMKDYDLGRIAKPYLIGTESDPEYNAPGAKNIVLTGDKDSHKQLRPKNNVIAPNWHGPKYKNRGSGLLTENIEHDEYDLGKKHYRHSNRKVA